METETLAVAQEANYTVIALFFRASITVQTGHDRADRGLRLVWAVTFTKLAMYRRARANGRGLRPPRSGRASRWTSV